MSVDMDRCETFDTKNFPNGYQSYSVLLTRQGQKMSKLQDGRFSEPNFESNIMCFSTHASKDSGFWEESDI